MNKQENVPHSVGEIMFKYIKQKPKDFGNGLMERCFPVTAIVDIIKECVAPLKSRISELEEEVVILNRDYNSDKKHYDAIEKSNKKYVEIIDKHINSDNNINYKLVLRSIKTLLNGGKAISALEVINKLELETLNSKEDKDQ